MAGNDESFGGLIRGGLRDYLDILAYRELTEIETKPLRSENQVYVKQDSPAPVRAGESSVPTVGGVSLTLVIGGALVVVAVAALLMRRG